MMILTDDALAEEIFQLWQYNAFNSCGTICLSLLSSLIIFLGKAITGAQVAGPNLPGPDLPGLDLPKNGTLGPNN